MSDRLCDEPGCDRPHKAKGKCHMHYNRLRERHRHRIRNDRLLPQRARNRATSWLVGTHRAEFERLYEAALAEVTFEASRLQVLADDEGVEITDDAQVWRFKPGPAPDDEDMSERLREAPCSRCVDHHEAGHRCPECDTGIVSIGIVALTG